MTRLMLSHGLRRQRCSDYSVLFLCTCSVSRLSLPVPRAPLSSPPSPFAAGRPLLISNLALHWVNDLPGALGQIKQV